MADENGIDPLIEQMDSMPVSTWNGHLSQRGRRFSDTDRLVQPPSSSETSHASSTLPKPSETSHIIRRRPQEHHVESHGSYPCLAPHDCNKAACAVAEVFNTTELLELILSFFSTDSILRVRSVRRSWDSLIRGSPQLRLHMFVNPCWSRPAADFSLLPHTLPGLKMMLGKPVHLGRWIVVEMTLTVAKRILDGASLTRRVRSRSIYEGMKRGLGPEKSNADWPRPSSTIQTSSHIPFHHELMVTQPPLVGMQAFIEREDANRKAGLCANECQASSSNFKEPDSTVCGDVSHLRPCAKISCDAGITLGFLAETTISLFARKAGKLNEENSATSGPDRRVFFKAIMSFCQPDSAPRKRSDSRTVTML